MPRVRAKLRVKLRMALRASETDRGVRARMERSFLHAAAGKGSGFLRIGTPPLTAKV